MKIKPITTGIIAAAVPLPNWIATMLFVEAELLIVQGYYDILLPPWALNASLLSLLISPLLGIIGIIHGAVKIKQKWSRLGILLSLVCFLENFFLLYGMIYLASRF